nr:aminotransferase class I/II-fold pyridoxal phosphate-dependent enzyme [Brevundimonas diminuta]
MLFAAAFDANGGIFEPLFTEADAIVSDSLNHASIIDGVRLCKAKRHRFATSDMADLEAQLKQARADGAREIIIATDGAFSMDGYVAKLKDIRALADQYGALIMVDDCHATGFMGDKGRGSYAHCGVEVDFATGTFGKALGGAMGGFICAKANVLALLKQRARPYLFSNALAPAVCGSSLEAIRIAAGEEGDALRAQLFANAARFRSAMTEAGFTLQPGEPPIIPRHARRRQAGAGHGGADAGTGRLCHRVQLPRGAARPGSHPHPDVGGAHLRTDRRRRGGVHGGW